MSSALHTGFLAVVLAFLSAMTLPAASLSGVVLDPSGAAVANAQLSLRNESTGEEHRFRTDKAGHFEADLAPGAYQLRIELTGFAPVDRRIVISDPQVLEIRLELAETRTELNIAGKGLALANSDRNYRALRDTAPKETYAVHNLVLKRDVGTLTLKSGRISFVPPVLGRVTMAAFSGEGEFTLHPATPLEGRYLHLLIGSTSVDEAFDHLVLCFTDNTYDEIRAQAEKGPDVAPERDVLEHFRKRVRYREEQPRSLLQYLLTGESIDNVEADILADLYNPSQLGFFNAYLTGRKHGDLRFFVRPRGAIPELGPEEVALIKFEPEASDEGIWYLAHREHEYATDRASSNEEKRSIHVDRYRMETAIARNGRLTALAELSFTPVNDGDRVVKFGLLPNLRVTRVTVPPDRESPYIQEKKKEDGSFYAILPERLVPGRKYSITIEYEGDKVVHNSGGGTYSVQARTSWYPSVNAFRDRSLFDLTFKVPKHMTTVGVGRLVKEWREDQYAASQWTSEIPLAVAGFNYGEFKKKERTDPNSKYSLEGYATTETPDYLRDAPGNLTPSRLIENTLVDAENSVRLYSHYFGQAPYGRLAITQQPEFNFGQSWPTLIYLPVSAFLDSTQRWMLMGSDAFRFADFIQEVTPHEVAHQWWGHMVGWASYHDQWLSEGFADFSAGLFLKFVQRDNEKYSKYWEHARKAILDKNEFGVAPNDAGPIWMGLRLNTHKTRGAYNRLVYPKGGYILHMLRLMMYEPETGDSRFIAMMQDFVKSYYNRGASTEDFKGIVEKHLPGFMNLDKNGSMSWFFDEWVYGTEVPGYSLDYSIDAEGGKIWLKGTVEQSAVSPNFKMLVPLYLDFDGKLVPLAKLAMTGNSRSKEFRVQLPRKPKRVLLNAEHDVLER